MISCGDSIKIIQHIINLCEEKFDRQILPFAKNELIKGVFWEREKQVRDFMASYSTFDLGMLFLKSYLIRKLYAMNEFTGEKHANSNAILRTIDDYSGIMDLKESKMDLESGNCVMGGSLACDVDDLLSYGINDLGKLLLYKTNIYPTEYDYRRIGAFAKYGIMSENDADVKMQEYRKQYKPVIAGSDQIVSVDETIKRFYDLMCTWIVGFVRNSAYKKMFHPRDNMNITINPTDLRKFLGYYPPSQDPTELDFKPFREKLMTIFGERFQEIIDNFVLSEDNLFAIPLFVKFGDTVTMSQDWTYMYSYYLHTIVHKKQFKVETEIRSKFFEKTVRKDFQDAGFRYCPEFGPRKEMEIDGLAIYNNKIFVVEVKGWGPHKFLDEASSQVIVTREIKSAVTGTRMNHNKLNTRQRPSLLEKIEWVKANREKIGISKGATVEGLLVTNVPPTISKYLGCKILLIDGLADDLNALVARLRAAESRK